VETIVERCAGLDVHKASVEVCARVLEGKSVREAVRHFGTMTDDLRQLGRWLQSLGVTHVAMESTGVYWKPIFNILEEDFTVLLCNARHIKNVPGRKTDVKDCQWIAQLLQHGLLSGSFIPPRAQRDLRDLTRHRAQLVNEQTRVANRIQKVLEDANIKLSSVASDTLGASGRSMIRALIAGERDPGKLAALARRKLKAKIPQLKRALDGHFTAHHCFMLTTLMRHLDFLDESIAEFDAQIEERVHSAQLSPPEPPGPDESGPGADPSEPPPMAFSAAVQALSAMPGIKDVGAPALLAEIGTDMSQFPSHKHLGSWSRICPGNNESAGKRKSGRTGKANRWLRRALCQCAWAASKTKNTYFAAQYRQIAKRRGKKRAIIALAHSMLTAIYHMLKYHTPYTDLGADFFDKIDPARKTRYHLKRLEELGHKVTIEPQIAAA
jgi:transposase